jgi:hypothetical protein
MQAVLRITIASAMIGRIVAHIDVMALNGTSERIKTHRNRGSAFRRS